MRKRKETELDASLRALASELERHLTMIRQEIRRPLEGEFAKGKLTGPQRSVMQALFHSDGCSLKELTAQVGLAHSTVSGIVDRLEAGGMVERRPDLEDRRHTRIVVSGVVRKFMAEKYPVLAADPILKALRKASPAQRDEVALGIRTLRNLLTGTFGKE